MESWAELAAWAGVTPSAHHSISGATFSLLTLVHPLPKEDAVWLLQN